MAARKTTTPRKGSPAFWTTGIAKSLSGDQPCLLSTWLAGHFNLAKTHRDDAQMAIWKTNHTEQLKAVIDKLRGEGWRVSVEQFFRLPGRYAIISGKADAIAQQPEKRPKILDVKSGTPRDSDIIQVAIEMVTIPHVWKAPAMTFAGEVIYEDHTVTVTPAHAAELQPKIFKLLRELGTMPRPVASPGESACKFCDVSKEDCPDRWEEPSASAALAVEETTTLF